jgi:hypothetical protein
MSRAFRVKLMIMTTEPIFPKFAGIFLLFLGMLPGTGYSARVSDSGSIPFLSPTANGHVVRARAVVFPWRILGEELAVADFDGDNETDAAFRNLVENQDAVSVQLSSRSGITVLKSSVSLSVANSYL